MFRRARTTGGAPGPGRLIVGLARSHGTGSRKANGRPYSPSAQASPEWSSRQLAAWITDNEDFSVSESTVFRILKREGLVRRIEVPVPASNEYRHKTTTPHQLWDRCFLLPRCRMGLLLHGDGDGRLLPVHPDLETAIRLVVADDDRPISPPKKTSSEPKRTNRCKSHLAQTLA